MVDAAVRLALALHSNRGAYAALLGSGVSAASGIPTGWQIVSDLISKVAAAEGAVAGVDPIAWYSERYGEPPDYSRLLDELARSPTERSLLLRRYFEPTDDERRRHVKVPSAGHRALAEMASGGYISVFLTTDFDRLLEQALEAAGVIPITLSTPDAFEGAAPLGQGRCTVVKLNGDYLDTRIKNTPAELDSYHPSIDRFLDRVIDEYGLIVCGWSGDWDTALRRAFERSQSHRYSTFWASRTPPLGMAASLNELRHAEHISILDADSFFTGLAAKVRALDGEKGDAAPHPVIPQLPATSNALVGRPVDMTELPTGTVTFLFTDIEGSTRLWEDAEELMRMAMVRHDEIVDRIVGARHGVNVSPRGEGDSRFIVFPDATDAVSAAIDLQRGLQTETWTLPRPIRVRIALHTGIADMRGGDYYGSAVNRAARLRGLAHGGQTVISGSTQQLVQDSLPAGISLRDMGLHGLKDLTRPEHVYQVNADGLADGFPPLKSLDARRHNLPTQLNELIGREREVAELASLLRRERLVTILAPGGTGKTRLAVEVAAEASDAFPDGVFFVPLAPLTNSDSVPQAIAEAIAVSLSSGADMQEQLLDYLRAKQQLLVLDNCEHLSAAATLVPAILAAAPGVRVLATSRARLNVSPETVYLLSGLVADGTRDVVESAAARLFVREGSRAMPGFEPHPGDEVPLRRILQLTQGTPLAILLAAAWVDTLSITEIAEEVASNVDFLESERADMPDRHRSMRAVFEYSWKMLGADERKLFSRLSLFRGGFTRDAAIAVAAASPRDLARLSSKSFLTASPGTGRFVVHELLRQYGEESLTADQAHRDETIRKHVQFYVGRLEAAHAMIIGGKQPAAVELIEADLDNLRAAWNAAIESGGSAMSVPAAIAFYFIYEVRGWHRPGADLFGDAASRLAARPEFDLRIRAFALASQGWFVCLSGDPQRGRHFGDQALELAESFAPDSLLFFTISCRNICLFYSGEMDVMFATTKPAIALARELGLTWWCNLMRDWTSHAQFALGQLAEAQAMAVEAQAYWEQTNDHWGMIWSLESLALIARAEGRLDEARERYRRLLEVSHELGFQRGILHTLNNLGLTSLAADDPAAAEGYLIDGLRVSNEIGLTQESLAALCDIATARIKLGDPQGALELVTAVIAHPASDQHQRYNPKTMRAIAEELRRNIIDAGATLNLSDPAPTLQAVVDSLLESSGSLRVSA